MYKLIEKGLVEVFVENGVKQFIAADPDSILLYMEERKRAISEQAKKLQDALPEMQKLKRFKNFDNVYLIKGFRGIQPIVYKALREANGEIKIMGVRSSKDKKFNIFWQHWHKERVDLKINAKMLFTDRNTEYWNFFKSLGNTVIRTVSELSPSAIMIIDENVFILSYEKEFTCIHIRSEDISKSFSSFFDGLWNTGKL